MTGKYPTLPNFDPGWVWLTGAGPGDPGLLTLYALHALAEADAVVYDALVGPEVLALANERAELIHAGKRGGKPSARQSDISRRLIDLAKAGRRVLRLKGGDPMIFGRGAEEAEALVQAGVRFRILPGVTAGLAAPAYAGIPLTARDINAAVTFMTGHTAAGTVPDTVDWEAVSKGSPVLVIYMALGHLAEIASRLQDAGRPGDEPVAVISKATLPGQQVVVARLDDCAKAARALEPPVTVVIGEVVRYRETLDWVGTVEGAAPDPGDKTLG